MWQARHHCVAVDLRGAGGSPRSENPVGIESHVEDLDALRRKLNLHSVVPVGCAVGAMVATAYAGTHANRCAGLVLSNPGLRTKPEARAMLAQRATDVRAGGIVAAIPGAVDSAFASCAMDERREIYLRRFSSQDALSYALQIEAILDADISRHLDKISCPTLVVAGDKDRLLPPDHARAIAAALADADLVEIGDGAHFIPYQRPQEFSELVSTFLRTKLGTGRGRKYDGDDG